MRTLVKMKFGSHVYGTNLPTSDMDFKAVHLPDVNDILLGRAKGSINTSTKGAGVLKNTAADTDFESFSLQKYMELLLQGQIVALTMLFMPKEFILEANWEWNLILANKDKWLHKGVSAFAGYCRQQANKYGIKGSRIAATRDAVEFFSGYPLHVKLKDIWCPILERFEGKEHCEFLIERMRGSEEHLVKMLSVCNRKVQEHITVKEAYKIYKHVFDEYGARALAAENNEGVDWKACMHAVRVAGEAYELLTTGHITYPRPDACVLKDIRQGKLEYNTVAGLIEDGLEALERAQAISKLPAEPNYDIAEQLVLKVYRDEIIEIYE